MRVYVLTAVQLWMVIGMDEYINKERLLKIYKNWLPQLTLKEDEGDRRGVETCIAVLESEPAVDAVEVVRCKDCIGQSTWYNDAEYGCAVCGMSGMYPKSEDGFCSYGLRKEGN